MRYKYVFVGQLEPEIQLKMYSKQYLDMAPIIKMFDNLKTKIMKADQHGLRSLTKK